MKLVWVLSMSFVISTALVGCSEWTHTYTGMSDMVKELGKGWQEESTPEKGDIFVPTGQEITVIKDEFENSTGDKSGYRNSLENGNSYYSLDSVEYTEIKGWKSYVNDFVFLMYIIVELILIITALLVAYITYVDFKRRFRDREK